MTRSALRALVRTKTPIILGATATGKSALAVELARRLNGDVISLDSMQVYEGMRIGTAAPTEEEMRGIPHHLIGTCPLHTPMDAALFIGQVKEVIAAVRATQRVPLLAGGTALYVKMLTDGMCDAPAAQPALRAELNAFADTHGNEALHRRLQEVDPTHAATLHPNDRRRVLRALEVFLTTGVALSTLQTQWNSAQNDTEDAFVRIGLTCPRDFLYERIAARVAHMRDAGLCEEVARLLSQGLEDNHAAMQAIGYKEMVAHLRGEITQETAIEKIIQNTRRFAKQQLTWFRKDTRIVWFDVTLYTSPEALADAVELWASGDTACVAPPPPRE